MCDFENLEILVSSTYHHYMNMHKVLLKIGGFQINDENYFEFCLLLFNFGFGT